ncbi:MULTISPECIES: heme lyase CcmF/NrfE family subunit [unclassified Halorhodospira]|uniref:heme lyase CcmF/NrfE family subunit n=1 Tax=unclassified Halorhodospira TaxID=2626748 RepID=UPI001EE783CD|nr:MULTISPECIES: heme lyase CcmF/NrfE family subunit [unclassified Halorhodospira]MCG5541560.1 heme lyase CcmF/NrfE family subunit [Halorhodospira sp. M39old]MCG5544623.1 heme lyase CcmF/NrfE family subunit [Halorhodospira sp. M38]
MLGELGNFALILAFCLAVIQSILPLIGTATGDARLMDSGRSLAIGQFVFLLAAYLILTTAFVTNDFSIRYVAENSATALPLVYKITGVWGGHEGSMLFWVLTLGAWTVAVAVFSRALPREMLARVLAVLGMVAVAFIAFTALTSNPFERIFPAPTEGTDLNPLLQDPGMIIHPPLLFIGYTGLAVAFAFAIAALIGGRLDAAWARWSRPWTTAAWGFLTLGIGLGSWWAYYELGWGGWWFWDPVENASLLPWLTATALIHSLAVTEKRGGFKVWTVMLAIVSFALTVLGGFIVRSGVITSVHAFATDPDRGVFLLAILAVTLLGSLALYAWRAPKVGLGGVFGWYSRESLLLANNVLLVVACAAIAIGTLYPLALDAFDLGKISVGPPYFDAVFMPLMLPLLFLIGIGPVVSWKQSDPMETVRQLRWVLLVSALIGGVWPLTMGAWNPLTALGLGLAAWILLTAAVDLFRRFSRRRQQGAGKALQAALRPSFFGMHLAHGGLALVVMAIAMVNTYEVERDVRLAPGETATAGAYQFRMLDSEVVRGPNFDAQQATVEVLNQDGEVIDVLHPQLRYYDSQPQMPMHQASLNRGMTRDVYVSLGDDLGEGAWTMRLYYKPYMFWMWTGCLLMAFGGFLAAADRRYRMASDRRTVSEAHVDSNDNRVVGPASAQEPSS